MKKILIIEDDPDISKAVAIRLRASGFDVVQAADGYLGLSSAIREQPDLLLLDISMPAGDGFSVVERLKAQPTPVEIPFIIFTASTRPEFRRTAQEMGAYAYFEKPFEAAELIFTINEALSTGHRLSV